jgi:hypothetical protein
MAQIHHILEKKNSKSPDFLLISSSSSKNILFKSIFTFVSGIHVDKIWLNSFLDNHHFGYTTKSLKKNTGVAPQGHLRNFGDLDKEHRGVLISVHYRSTNIDLDSVVLNFHIWYATKFC